MPHLGRRTLLKLASAGATCAALPWAHGTSDEAPAEQRALVDDGILAIAFDDALRTRISGYGRAITGFDASESLLLEGGDADAFSFVEHRIEELRDPRHGAGRHHQVRGHAGGGLEKTVEAIVFARYPGMAVLQVHYRNGGAQPLSVRGWRNAAHELADAPGGFWSFSGATHADRRDWVQPLGEGFDQRNSLAMVASDYGGGTPVANLWRHDVGLAVGHLEPVPRQLDLPVRKTANGVRIAVESPHPSTLAPGQSLATDRTFVCVHKGDHYAPLLHYRGYMGDQGISAPHVPTSALAPIWCAWGYGRNFSREQVLGTLPKVRELGFEWVVLDDGWQNNEGDWKLDRSKFPRGEADMRAFVQAVKAQGLRPRLWLAPLAADPGSDVLHDSSDMLLLDADGSVQKVSWWNAFTQCPAYPPTVDYYVALVRKIIGDWGFEGLKLDGQHLNAVAPCHNPLHRHARPEESCEKLADFWNALQRATHEADPEALVELCPCGTVFAFHNLPATGQYPASDPLSSWQVRSKGKTFKALIGRGSSYAGDHVELSDGGDDFASSVGIGAVISTKFTWPADTERPAPPLPPGGFVLTPQKEALWKKWADLYHEHMLPQGDYLGGLYDIGFDKPEAHAIASNGAMYYAFYAKQWNGPLQLRGLGKRRYRVRDLFNGVELGTVDPRANTLDASFERFLLLQATPTGEPA